MHTPYTFVVPDYTESSFNPEYYGQLSADLSAYRSSLLGSSATRLEKTLQLATIRKFTTDDAIVTSSTTRDGTYGVSCTNGEGFLAYGVPASCGNGICDSNETSSTCSQDCAPTIPPSTSTDIIVEGVVKPGEWLQFGPFQRAASGQVTASLRGDASLGGNDGNLYVKKGAAPTLSTYDCRSNAAGTSTETCSVSATSTDTIYVSVYGAAASASAVSMKISNALAVPPRATVYENGSYGGAALELVEGSYVLTGVPNNNISSVKVPAGLKLTMSDRADFTGSSAVYTADTSSLGGFNNLASSVVVSRLGTGLSGTYYNSLDFSGPVVLSRTEAVDFDWDAGSPAAGVNQDYFSARWEGRVEADKTELYTFYVTGDDGVRLWVDGQLLIDAWVIQGPTEYSATMNLVAGRRYDIRLEYYEYAGNAEARLRWSSPSTSKQAIPASNLYPVAAAPSACTDPGVCDTTYSQAGLTVAGEQWHYFGPFYPKNNTALTATISGGNEADLYIRTGAPPTYSSWDQRPYLWGTNESASLTSANSENDGGSARSKAACAASHAAYLLCAQHGRCLAGASPAERRSS